jgi:hypothetical protein
LVDPPQSLPQLAALVRQHPQQMASVRVLGLARQNLAVQLFSAAEVAPLMGCQRGVEQRRHWDAGGSLWR